MKKYVLYHSECSILQLSQQAQGFQFLYILPTLVIVFNFFILIILTCEVKTTLWFWPAFFRWLVMMIIFPYACWSFWYHLWRNIHSNPLLIFLVRLFDFFCWWVIEVLNIWGYISIPYRVFSKYFLLLSRLSFHSVDCVL